MSKPLSQPLTHDVIYRHTISEGFTQSEFSEMSCFQRWNWRYNQLLIKTGTIQFPFAIGTAFHDAMEQFYATKGMRVHVATLQFQDHEIPSLVDIEEQKYWNAVLPAMVEAYTIHYKSDPINWDILEIEKEVDIVYRGFRLRGKIDLQIKDRQNEQWIVDHKTASRLTKDVVAGWDFRFQFMFYIWLMWKVATLQFAGYMVNLVKKPELRVKQSENLLGFAARVKEDMIINPDKYFFREKYPINQSTLQHFEDVVLNPKLEKIRYIMDNPTHLISRSLMIDKNTDECQKWGGAPCAYIDLCRFGYEKMGFLYDTKPRKHEELNETNN